MKKNSLFLSMLLITVMSFAKVPSSNVMISSNVSDYAKVSEMLVNIAPEVNKCGVSAANTEEDYEAVYFINTYGWEKVYAYVWNDLGQNNQWPGHAMEYLGTLKLGGGELYAIAYDADLIDYIIFNNGDGTQTTDLVWTPDHLYANGNWYNIEDVLNPTIFTVAGSSEVLFGTVWEPTNTENDMLLNAEGNYSLTIYDAYLAAGKIEYKIVALHDWAFAIPGQNQSNLVLDIKEGGYYDVTFTYNPESGVVSAVAEPIAFETVYFVNMYGWEKVYAYVWNDLGQNNQWPGEEMDFVEQNWNADYYGITYRADLIDNVIFTNGVDEKTNDLVWTPDHVYALGEWVSMDEVYNPTSFTIAGSSEALFGTVWDATNTKNDLLLNSEGIYALVKNNVYLTPGAIEYKLVMSHNWAFAFPGLNLENLVMNIEEAGYYNIIYTLDWLTGDLIITIEFLGSTTGCGNINANVALKKRIENNQLIITNGNLNYNATGAVVK